MPLEPNPVPVYGWASATSTLDGPASDESLTTTVTIDGGASGPIELSDAITVPACPGPNAPPDVTFTFHVTPSVTRAIVGQTITYSYCGTNTSTIPLEVMRVVDDRIGLVAEGGRVVAPGELICNTDIGNTVSYTVRPDDAGKVIHNNAVVTVRTQEDEPRQFQGTATSDVAVPLVVLRAANVAICHSNGSGGFVWQTLNGNTVVEGKGHNSDNHEGGRDIIPPGPWDPVGRNWLRRGERGLHHWAL